MPKCRCLINLQSPFIRWSGELLVITHQGALTSYYLGVSDGVVHQAHTFLFTWPYAMGLSTAVLVPQFNMLLLGGVTTPNDEGARGKGSVCLGDCHGLLCTVQPQRSLFNAKCKIEKVKFGIRFRLNHFFPARENYGVV